MIRHRPVLVAAPLLIGLAGCALLAFAALHGESRPILFRAYLHGWLLWLGVSLGSMALAMVHNLTGGDWGLAIRRAVGPAALLVPLMVLLSLPMLAGLPELFPWVHPHGPDAELWAHRAPYLNLPFFLSRAVIYFIIWIVLAFVQRALFRRVLAGKARASERLSAFSAAGLIIYLLTMTHASTDWLMSRDAASYSTAFGFVVTVGQTLSAMAFAIIIVGFTHRQSLLSVTHKGIFNDIGNLLLVLVILWAYVSFMQLLVIWMGNTNEDNPYYVARLGSAHAWRWVSLALIVAHFFVPFFILLFRSGKQYIPTLVALACFLFAAHVVEQFWLVIPSAEVAADARITWLDLVAPIAIGGIWLAAFAALSPSVPAVDPLRAPPQEAAHG